MECGGRVKLPPGTYWITRDGDLDGMPGDSCDIWTERPTRYVCELNEFGIHSAFWLMDDFDLSCRVGDRSHKLASVQRYFGVVPDDDRQCIKVEHG